MSKYTYHMPTQLFVGDIQNHAHAFQGFGNQAFIVSGKSAAKNGALQDVQAVLNGLGIGIAHFDQVEENPSVQTVETAAKQAMACGATFIIGIGGGSPMDAAKAVAVLTANPDKTSATLFEATPLPALPVVLIPTTAGTGSETTPFSILTRHDTQTKASMSQLVFAQKALLDGRYMEHLPEHVTLSSAVDALSHLVEGYTSTGSTFLSDRLAEGGLLAFADCMEGLKNRAFTPQLREELLLISALAGMVIAQTKTTLPHQLGYALTYHKAVPHGFACGLLMTAFLRVHENKGKVQRLLKLLNLTHIEDLEAFLNNIISLRPTLTQTEAESFVAQLWQNPDKLKNYPFAISQEMLLSVYANSLRMQ